MQAEHAVGLAALSFKVALDSQNDSNSKCYIPVNTMLM